MGYYLRRTTRTLKMDMARAGWTAKRAAQVYTRRKKLNGHPLTFSLSLPLPQETCARADSKAELPGRELGGSLQARGGARRVQVCRARAKRGKGLGGPYQSC